MPRTIHMPKPRTIGCSMDISFAIGRGMEISSTIELGMEI